MADVRQVIAPELVCVDGALQPDVQLVVDSNGRFADAADAHNLPDGASPGRCAALPGFVNAHSHAFQRGLRGLGETFPVEEEEEPTPQMVEALRILADLVELQETAKSSWRAPQSASRSESLSSRP